jgi:hypothetical protein
MMTGLERQLAIVVPVGPGDPAWRQLSRDLAACAAGIPVIAVACDDVDRAALSREWPACRVVMAGRGRARQLNAGARAADTEWLWFLHADSRIDPPAVAALAGAVSRGRDALHWFRLGFEADPAHPVRVNALGAWIRSRWLGLPFGDQGFLLRRRTFLRLGGFDERIDRGEDHAFVWRARRAGLPLVEVPARILTSARRYQERGWLRTTVGHLGLTAMQAFRFSRGER